MTLDPLDSALYRELVPHRITRAAPNACHDGPTAGWAELELRRELWALALDADLHDDHDDRKAG